MTAMKDGAGSGESQFVKGKKWRKGRKGDREQMIRRRRGDDTGNVGRSLEKSFVLSQLTACCLSTLTWNYLEKHTKALYKPVRFYTVFHRTAFSKDFQTADLHSSYLFSLVDSR